MSVCDFLVLFQVFKYFEGGTSVSVGLLCMPGVRLLFSLLTFRSGNLSCDCFLVPVCIHFSGAYSCGL